jgi:hypothetical protein
MNRVCSIFSQVLDSRKRGKPGRRRSAGVNEVKDSITWTAAKQSRGKHPLRPGLDENWHVQTQRRTLPAVFNTRNPVDQLIGTRVIPDTLLELPIC